MRDLLLPADIMAAAALGLLAFLSCLLGMWLGWQLRAPKQGRCRKCRGWLSTKGKPHHCIDRTPRRKAARELVQVLQQRPPGPEASIYPGD